MYIIIPVHHLISPTSGTFDCHAKRYSSFHESFPTTFHAPSHTLYQALVYNLIPMAEISF